MGFTFKENCPDVRNTKVIDIYSELLDFGLLTDVHDHRANSIDVFNEYGINLVELDYKNQYSAIILAVAHKEFLNLDIRSFAPNGIVFDVKGILSKADIDSRL